ncbi:hypothetical protein ES703_30063 [subsurface metagenome]
MPGTDSTAQLSLPTFATILQGDTSYTIDSAEATGDDKIIELDQFDYTTLGESEKITINGTDQDGSTITEAELAIDADTTLTDLINQISSAFSNSTTSLVDGQILLTDDDSGASSTTITLEFVAGGGSDATFEIPTFSEITGGTDGGTVSASVTSLDPDDFIETQDAQNSEIRIDGYPNSVPEVQILTSSAPMENGEYSFTYMEETTISFTESSTLADVQTEIDALLSVSPGDIMVSGTVPSDNATDTLIFTFSSSLGNVTDITINGDPDPGTHTMSTQTQGDIGWINRNSNSVTDVLTGITLNLHDVTEVSDPIEITINRNTAYVRQKIQTMVTAYNALITELKSKTEYDAETKKIGILSKDIAVSFIKTQTRDPFIGIVDGFVDTIDSFVQAFDIGISIDGAGMMEFDQDDFNDAINEDFMDVLELLGATKSGNSNSTIVQFYNASDKYTTAGTYDIEVDIDTNAITDVRIRLSSESTWRDDATWPNNLVTGNSTFDDYGDPLYPENSLQLTVDPNQPNGTYTATVRVKQGMAGALEDLLDQILEADGRLDTSEDILDDKITAMERRIENEENRLTKVETRLIAKFARLEKMLAMMQQQMSAVSVVSQITFGG